MTRMTRPAVPALLLALGILVGCGDQEARQAERAGERRGDSAGPTADLRAPGQVPGSGATDEQVDERTVRQAERQLQAAGFNPGKVDGIVDDETREAVRKFQEENRLQPTGELNQDTLLALKAKGDSAGAEGQPGIQ